MFVVLWPYTFQAHCSGLTLPSPTPLPSNPPPISILSPWLNIALLQLSQLTHPNVLSLRSVLSPHVPMSSFPFPFPSPRYPALIAPHRIALHRLASHHITGIHGCVVGAAVTSLRGLSITWPRKMQLTSAIKMAKWQKQMHKPAKWKAGKQMAGRVANCFTYLHAKWERRKRMLHACMKKKPI